MGLVFEINGTFLSHLKLVRFFKSVAMAAFGAVKLATIPHGMIVNPLFATGISLDGMLVPLLPACVMVWIMVGTLVVPGTVGAVPMDPTIPPRNVATNTIDKSFAKF